MKQYGIDEAEIAEERLEKCFFRYKTPYERKTAGSGDLYRDRENSL